MTLSSYWDRIQTFSGKQNEGVLESLVQAMITDAIQGPFSGLPYEGEFPKIGFGVSNLRSRDVAQTNQGSGLFGGVAGSGVWGVTAVTVSTWTDWINLAIDNRSYHLVAGVFNRSTTPSIVRIRPKTNGEDQPQIDLEAAYNFEEPLFWIEQPYAVRPGNNHTVRVYTERTIAGIPAERIGLHGFVMAKRAYLIQE